MIRHDDTTALRRRFDTSGQTFSVDAVERATERLAEVSYADGLRFALSVTKLEAYSRHAGTLVTPRVHPIEGATHPFLRAVNLAYADHRSLVLSPDMIWLLLAQGFARHVNENVELMRSRFVAHEGKVEILVIRDEFVRGFEGNDWEGVFAEFSEQIRAHIGPTAHGLIARTFSTTGIVEKAAMEVTLMDAFQGYFEYRVLTRCGIPEITLKGTPDDWVSVRDGAAAFADYGIEWWTEHLLPVLDQFVAASQGDINTMFWQNFYKQHGGSGGPFISGQVVNFFPYVKGHRGTHRNPYLGPKAIEERMWGGLTSDAVPSALSAAPFTWEYLGRELPMEFIAGFIGVAQDWDTLALRPEIGWAVRDRKD
jgi:hypothetical protein